MECVKAITKLQTRCNKTEELLVKILTVDNAKKFVHVCESFKEDIDITCGSYVIDAKSLLGIFSIDLTRMLKVHIHTSDKDIFELFKFRIREFIVNE